MSAVQDRGSWARRRAPLALALLTVAACSGAAPGREISGPLVATIDSEGRWSCGGALATIVGTAGNDRIVGTMGRDVIVALAGDDAILGLDGDDVICGGPGADRIDGGRGKDAISGNDGNDVLAGGPGDDSVTGDEGDDTADGGPGNDWVGSDPDPGDDVYFGGGGSDTLIGGLGADHLTGGSGSDSCDGQAAADVYDTCETTTDETLCDNGIDDDVDGLVDCSDEDCAGAPSSCTQELALCADGLDNDADGAADCADPECTGDASCSAARAQRARSFPALAAKAPASRSLLGMIVSNVLDPARAEAQQRATDPGAPGVRVAAVGGARTEAEARSTVPRAVELLERCAEQGRAAREASEVRVRLEVAASGRVSPLAIVERDAPRTRAHLAFRECAVRTLARVRLEAGGTGTIDLRVRWLAHAPPRIGALEERRTGAAMPASIHRERAVEYPAEEVHRVAREHRHEVRACFDDALARRPDVHGTIHVRFTIAPDGSVTHAAVESDDAHVPTLASCVVGRVRTWTFARPTDGAPAQVSHPFVFRSE